MKYTINRAGFLFADNIKLSYTDFYDEVFDMAQFLKSGGIVAGTKVVVEVEKTIQSLRNIIAIVACGAIFIPVEKGVPQSLKDMIIKENSAALLDGDIFSHSSGVSSIFQKSLHYCVHDYVIERELDDPLYIIYTSGTTGQRKGVIITSRNLSNYLSWLESEFNITSKDSTFLVTSLAFDLSYTAVFSALKSGASLYFPKKSSGFNAEELASLISQNSVSYLKLTPSIIRMLLSCGQLSMSSSLRLVLSGGEPINTTEIAKFRTVVGNQVEIVNHYGPTETTIGCCFKRLDFTIPAWNEYCTCPSIGKAIANTILRIVDNNGDEIASTNTVGELVISGEGVGKGYAQGLQGGFVGGKFKSGDLAFYNEKRDIVLCGRQDDMLKINGYRMSLGEICRAIESIDIWQSSVCCYDKELQQVKIFYVSAEDLDYISIYNALKEKLPHNIIPTYYARVPEIPCTINGKIDFTKLLRISEKQRTSTAETHNGPSEKLFYEALQECHTLGTFDYYALRDKTFTDLGLSSLDIIEIFCYVEDKFNIALEMGTFINCKSISECCAFVLSLVEKNEKHKQAACVCLVQIDDLAAFKDYLSHRIETYRTLDVERYSFLPTQKYYYAKHEQTENVLSSVFKVENGFIDSFIDLLSTGYVFRTLINYSERNMFVANTLPNIDIPFVDKRIENDILRLCFETLSGDSMVPYIFYITSRGIEKYIVCLYKHAFILMRDFFNLNRFGSKLLCHHMDDKQLLDKYICNLGNMPQCYCDNVLKEFSDFYAAHRNIEDLLGNEHGSTACSTGPILINKTSQSVLAVAFATILGEFYKLKIVPLKIFLNNLSDDCFGLLGDHTDFAFTAVNCGDIPKQNILHISDYIDDLRNNNIISLEVLHKNGEINRIPNRTAYVNVTTTHSLYKDDYVRYIDSMRRACKKNNVMGVGLYSEYNVDNGILTVFIGADFDAKEFIQYCGAHFAEIVDRISEAL